MRRRFVLAAVGLILGGTLLAAASTASALTGSSWKPVAGGMGFFRGGTYTGSFLPTSSYESMAGRMAAGAQVRGAGKGVGTGFTEGTITKGAAIWEKVEGVAVTAGTVQAVRQIKGEGLTVMQAVKGWPLLKTLGTIGLVGSAFQVGWEVGSELSVLFFGETGEPVIGELAGENELTAIFIQPLAWKDNLCEATGSGTPCAVLAPSPGFFTFYQQANGPMWGGTVEKNRAAGGCPEKNYFNAPPHKEIPLFNWTINCTGPGTATTVAQFVPVGVDSLPGEKASKPGLIKSGTAPTPSNAAEAQEAVEECLESETACGGINQWWPANDPDAQEDMQVESGYDPALGPADPLESTVPDCSSKLWLDCKETLEDKELTTERVEVGWEQAVITKPAGSVLELKPAAGAKLSIGSKVQVVTNPDTADMPLLVPQWSTAGESYTTYITKLDPRLEPNEKVLTEFQTSPDYGPEQVVRTNPGTQTRLNPSTTHAVDVYVNPADAPFPAAGWSPPGINSIDLSPLTETGLGCDVFPFGIPCYMFEVVSSFDVDPECPVFELPAVQGEELVLDMCVADPALDVFRPVMLAIASVGIVVFFSMLAMGRGSSEE